ncbi:hypothetical protein GCM10018953_21840 [Streptosporangium nondiastaticum]|uniref:hypothetical protein n=1 Tax=Streptosporangium TaxID=2000 RepID=UPI0031FA2661
MRPPGRDEETTDALFLLERLEPMTIGEPTAAGEEPAGLLRAVSPGARVETRIVGPADGE